MKNINALLNSLLSTPADSTGQPQSQNPVSSKGSKAQGNTFGSVLAQLASQNAPANQGNVQQNQQTTGAVVPTGSTPTATLESNAVTPSNSTGGTSAGSFTTVSETTVAINESVKAGNAGPMAQAEQALVSLASGLAQLIQMISSLQQSEPKQAQAVLASLSEMNLTPAGLQSILNSLQPLIQKLPADQNPLLLPSSQQAGLLNQMFQQMIQAQQVLMGGTTSNQANNSNQMGPVSNIGAMTSLNTSASNNGQNTALQILFSNANLTGMAQNQVQSTQVLLNLANFKMTATFIQAGISAGQSQGQAATPVNSQNVINEINQALENLGNTNSPTAITAPTQAATANVAGLQNNLSQNFNNLVQLLMQSGVTQAALTSFITNQQKGGESQNAFNAATNAGQTVSANNLTPVTPVSGEIQMVVPAALTGESTNNANTGQPVLPAENNFMVNDMVSGAPKPFVQPALNGNPRVSNVVENTQTLSPLPQQPLFQSAVNQTALAALFNNPQRGNGNQNIQNLPQTTVQTVSSNNMTRVLPVSAEIQPVIPANLVGAPANPANAAQSMLPGENDLAANEMGAQVAIPPIQTEVNENSKTSNAVAGAPTLSNGEQLSAVQTGPEPFFGLNTKEISTLDTVVAMFNSAALHPTQGSLNIGPSVALPSSALTMGQILGSVEANQLSSGSLVDPNGNPSVPLPTPAPVPQALLNPQVNNDVLSVFTENQLPQPKTVIPFAVTNNQTLPILSTISTEPVNQAVQPLVPGVPNEPLINLASTNGVVTLPTGLNNGPSTGPILISPSSAVAGSAGTVSLVVNNPEIINPLPQPATLPNSGTSPVQVNNNPSSPRFIPSTNFDQAENPAPTSQTPTVPALASAGEAVKAEIPNLAAGNNNNNVQTAVNNSQPVSTIKSLSAEAVSPVVSVSPIDSNFNVSSVAGSNSPNNSTILEENALLGATTLASNQTHGSTAFSLSATPPSNAGSTGSIDSAQILNQIMQQVAAQTADAKTISRLNFQLIPESLGKVTVQIALVDQSVSARIIVSNPDIREVLQTHLVDLKSALSQAGLQIDQLQVQVQGGGGNLLAQYFQYQQEGSGYRLPASWISDNGTGQQNNENASDLALFSTRTSLVNVLA